MVDYDKQVRELAFDQRAKPKDRTKTEEELALEQKEALEKAERQRRKRMVGDDSDGSGDEAGKGRKRKRVRGGDDLEDDFVEDGFGGIGAGLGNHGDSVPDDDIGEEGSTSEDEGTDEDSEVDGDGSEAWDDGSAEPADSEEETSTRVIRSPKTSNVSVELPYTFPCPESHDDFLQIVEDIREEDVPTVVQRIRTLYHPSLAPDNKLKLQVSDLHLSSSIHS